MTTLTQRDDTLRPLRRLRSFRAPGTAVAAAEEHLHYDREARVWLTHAELGDRRTRAAVPAPALAECA